MNKFRSLGSPSVEESEVCDRAELQGLALHPETHGLGECVNAGSRPLLSRVCRAARTGRVRYGGVVVVPDQRRRAKKPVLPMGTDF